MTAVVLAAPQMALFRKQVESGHEGSFMKFGWIYQAHDYGRAEGVWALFPIVGGFFRFWWMSLGPALPLFLIALVLMGWDVMLASAHAALNADHTLTSAVAAAEVYLPDNEDANASTATTARAVRPGVRSRVRGLQCADDTSLGEHLWLLFVSHLPEAVQQVVMGERSLAITSLDHVYMGINRATITGRGADTMKMALGAFLVFMVGNYINFQPWDRDNCKLFYLWVFVYSAVVGAMLAAPLEFFLHQGPGFARILQWTGVLPSTTIPLTQQLEVGAAPTTSPAATRVSAGVSVSAPRMLLARSVGLTTFLSVPVLLTVLVFSGFMSIRREYTMNHVLLDRDQQLVCFAHAVTCVPSLACGAQTWSVTARIQRVV
ncbi:MAG: hypothetical protein EOO65_03255 [Methanosarcinales archaeon]|nr:MAG: hypothetical protein EOO65_03255 [Methanosarcinales archaeon]